MGILHAVYGEYILILLEIDTTIPILGAGALVSPLIATQFAQLPRWSFHFLTSMGIALANTALLVTVFRFKTQDGKHTAQSYGATVAYMGYRMPCTSWPTT